MSKFIVAPALVTHTHAAAFIAIGNTHFQRSIWPKIPSLSQQRGQGQHNLLIHLVLSLEAGV
jgi:hypothetical protein